MVKSAMHKPNVQQVTTLARVIVCLVILILGAGVTRILVSLKKAPQVRDVHERALLVSGMVAEPATHEVPIRGFGELRVLNAVDVSVQISGIVTAVHPTLEVGAIIREGEVLFKVDDREYRAIREEAAAMLNLQKESITRLNTEVRIDAERLTKLKRSAELSLAEFRRVEALLNDDQIGTRSGIEAAERAYNMSFDQAAQLERAVQLNPIRIREAQSNRDVMQARLDVAGLNLEHCAIKAPVTGRITHVNLELGQLVAPGRSVVSLADDRLLEMHVSLDSRDAQGRLRVDQQGDVFSLRPTSCKVQWTEDVDEVTWAGRLDRAVRFDAKTRTLVVAVRVDPSEAFSQTGFLPMEGMYCRVELPCQPLVDAYKLPRSAVTFEGQTYASVSNHLKTLNVEVARIDGDHVYVTKGIAAGTKIITTRLVNPLEGTRLEWAPMQDR